MAVGFFNLGAESLANPDSLAEVLKVVLAAPELPVDNKIGDEFGVFIRGKRTESGDTLLNPKIIRLYAGKNLCPVNTKTMYQMAAKHQFNVFNHKIETVQSLVRDYPSYETEFLVLS